MLNLDFLRAQKKQKCANGVFVAYSFLEMEKATLLHNTEKVASMFGQIFCVPWYRVQLYDVHCTCAHTLLLAPEH